MRTEIREVPVNVFVKLPEELTAPCEWPEFSEGASLTYGDVVEYLTEVFGRAEMCNAKLERIRALQEEASDNL